MFTVDTYTPTRVIFGAGRLEELASVELPGTKALICVTADGLMEKIGVQQRVLDLLAKNNVEAAIFSDITPNPNRETVMAAAALAEREGCDFFIGLGGGSSIDVAVTCGITPRSAAAGANPSRSQHPSSPSPLPAAPAPRQTSTASSPRRRPPRRSISPWTRYSRRCLSSIPN